VTITGTNFAEATVATFGGTEAANVTLQCDHDHRDGTGGHGTKAYEQNTQQSPRYSPNAKDNFEFELKICGWRGDAVLDLRRKR
jgi:hypothetical protein